MKPLSLLIAILIGVSIHGQINIIPRPVSMKQPKIASKFLITSATEIVLEGGNLGNVAGILNDYLKEFYNIKLKVVKTPTNNNSIFLNYERMDNPIIGAYQMTVDNKGIYIAGDNETGVFYGVQTLIQLLPVDNDKPQTSNNKLQIPYVSIEDYPRFEYRGMHLDCGRHFFPVSFIKKYIDYIALHKMNYFHWHLTEDQGWRIEIKKYPRLTEVGAWRNGTIIGRYPGLGNDGIGYGGFYTQDEIKDVVVYAAKRYITVIPEIEMPGHSSAAIAAYPFLSCFPNESTKHKTAWGGDSTGKQVQQAWGVFEDVFCAGKDSTFKFLEDVLDEVMTLFPSKYIHVGGDECPKANWKRCPLCQQRIKEEHLKNEEELQSYFIQRIEKYLNSKGRILVGWDEILEGGLAANAVVISWRGEAGGIAAARQKHNVVMTPGGWVYFDHSQTQNEDSVTIGGYLPLEKTYSYEPVSDSLTKEQGKYILGAQGNVWSEYMSNERKVEYMIFPRMSALSEVLWSPKKDRDSVDFEKRLRTQFKRYDLWGVNYSKAVFDLASHILPTEDYNGIKWVVEQKRNMPCQLRFQERKKLAVKRDSVDQNEKFSDTKFIKYISRDSAERFLKSSTSLKDSVNITSQGIYTCYGYKVVLESDEVFIDANNFITKTEQKIYFNKATGKKITLTNQPARTYQGDGAFTLVNGIQNEKGLEKPREFLGFNGTDCEAVIDLGAAQSITNVKVHILQQPDSWIWRPQYAEFFSSYDGINFTSIGMTDDISTLAGNGVMEKTFDAVTTRYIKIVVKNWGIIPEGRPGAGSKAWLFVNEIEVN
ncbi:MAG: family 20 glycosylhydrolase [Chitinophagales bacterium]